MASDDELHREAYHEFHKAADSEIRNTTREASVISVVVDLGLYNHRHRPGKKAASRVGGIVQLANRSKQLFRTSKDEHKLFLHPGYRR